MNNKGSMLDVIMILVIIFAALIVAMVAFKVTDGIDDALRGTSDDVDNLLNIGQNNAGMWNYLIPIAFVGLLIAVVVMAFRIQTHPIFLIGSVIVLIVALILAAQFSNIFDDIAANNTVMGNYSATNFPLPTLLMNNLPVIALVVGIGGIMIMYSKSQQGGVNI